MYKLLFIHLGLLLSCSGNTNQMSEIDDLAKQKSINRIDSLLKKCIPRHDTVINANTSVHYVIIDTFYTVKMKVGGIDTLLDYRFNCNVPRGLVPSLHSYYGNTVCLIRGSGQHYREFVVAYAKGEVVVVKKYETALATDLKTHTVIYQNYNKLEEIIVEDIKTESKKIFILPAKYVNSIIISTSVKSKKLEISLSNGRMVFDL